MWYTNTEEDAHAMLEQPKPEKKGLPMALIVGVAAALLLGGGVAALAVLTGGPKQLVELTPEAKAYTRNLQLGSVEMKATEAYVGNALVEITGKITNNGATPVKQVDLMCVFYDLAGQVLTRERVAIVRPSAGGLAPGVTKGFRLPFDNLGQNWNQRMPQMVIAGIVF